jgi:tetratricopeptide (TPR) repeat protein
LSVFETFARGASDASQPGLVAWYRYKTKAFDPALEWFRLALEKGGDATVAHGLAHTLRSLNRTRETEDVAYAWRNHLINNAILFIDILERDLTKPAPPPIETARLQRYAQVTLELTSGEGAQGLGWYAYNTCQFEAAYEWFQRAVAWSPKEATVYGLLMAAERTGKRERIVDIANRYDGMFPKVVEYVFPDGKWRPPTPCDIIKNDPTGKLHLLERAQAQAAQQQAGWQFEANAPRAMARPRAAFPKAVSPENPLRAASNGALTQNAAESDRAPAPNAPLVARRVLGAGAMPYEEFGFSLLPAIDGSTIAKGAHNAQTAGAGTIWATEQVEDARSTTGTSLFDLMSRDAPRVFETLRHAGRVPMPREVARSAPSASNAPNGRPLNFAPGMVSMETTGSIPDRDKRAGKRAPQAADRASRFELGAPMPEASGFTKSTGSAPK